MTTHSSIGPLQMTVFMVPFYDDLGSQFMHYTQEKTTGIHQATKHKKQSVKTRFVLQGVGGILQRFILVVK